MANSIDDYTESHVIGYLELIIACYFSIEIMGNFYFHPKPKCSYLLRIDTWIDISTVLPELIPLIIQSNGGSSVSFLRILRIFKIMRIMKFRKTLKKIQLGKKQKELELNVEAISRLKKQAILLIISLFATLFISAGIINFVHTQFEGSMSQELKFLDSFYFVVITGTTIGYGDIYPKTAESRIIISFMVVFIFVIFGDQISKIIAIVKDSDKYDNAYQLNSHTIVFNNKSIKVLVAFLFDHLMHIGSKDTKILVIDDVSMTNKMSKILNFDLFLHKVHFLSVRNGVTPKTLIKACVKHADSIFLISDPYSQNGDEQDKKSLFLKTFLRNNGVN